MRRYRFIERHADRYSIQTLARALGVSRSGFYDWRDRPDSTRAQRRGELADRVVDAFVEHHGVYGSRKIAAHLVEQKVRVCRNTVARLMSDLGLHSKAQRRRKFVATTDSGHAYPVADNVLGRDFTASKPDEKWVADITYVATDEGFVYMAAVMDLYSRRIVGWAVRDSLETSLVIEAINNALEMRRPDAGLVCHSDRGCQYASGWYRGLLQRHGIECSMSRSGNCWDNACMERFMGAYKGEWIRHHEFETAEDVRRSTFEYIELFYNRKRRHQAIGYVSPCEYERNNSGNNAA